MLLGLSCPSNGANPVTVSDELLWMSRVLASLDSNVNVERYAWFTARATNVGTIPSLLYTSAGNLTQVGAFYNAKGDRLVPAQALSSTGSVPPQAGSSTAGAGTGGGGRASTGGVGSTGEGSSLPSRLCTRCCGTASCSWLLSSSSSKLFCLR